MKALVVKASGGGGLGDSVKAVVCAALYAERSQRALYVDWRGGVYDDGQNNMFDHILKVVGVDTLTELPESEDVYPEAWQGRLDCSLHQVYQQDGWLDWQRDQIIKRYSFDLSRIDYPQQVLVMWEFDQISSLLKSVNVSEYANLINRFLVPSERMLEFVNEIPNYDVGLHIRATDEFAKNKGVQVCLADYLRELEKLKQLSKQPLSLFLATDNQVIQQQFLLKYPDASVNEKLFADHGKPLHLGRHKSQQLESLESAMRDVLSLSRCKTLIATPSSSFSELAQFFAPTPPRVIYAQQVILWRVFDRLKARLRLANRQR